MDHFEYRSGSLWCEGVEAEEIARRFGTPTYVYSRATLEGHYDRLASAFAELDPMVCFSIKSCPNLAVCRVLAERGSGMDVVSGGELARALAAGCPASRIVYAGVGKTDEEIEAALRTRTPAGFARAPDEGLPIGHFNVESEQEFEVVSGLARRAGVRASGLLRVNPDVDPRTHAYTATGKKESKFGVDIERALAFFERYGRDQGLSLDGIHLHIGSPVYETGPYAAAVEKALGLIDELARRGFRARVLDLGGGFGADYESDRSPPAAAYAGAIVPLLRARVRDAGLRVILEPGRTISANAGVLLTRVQFVKEGGRKRFVICDAGMHTLIRPSLYGSFHFIWPARPLGQGGEDLSPARRSEAPDLPGLVVCDVVGPICESGDFLAKDRALPPVARGDLLAVFTSGAYGMAMASRYNSHALPAEVLVSGTEARGARRRDTIESMLEAERDERG